jgi:hypothetical protein
MDDDLDSRIAAHLSAMGFGSRHRVPRIVRHPVSYHVDGDLIDMLQAFDSSTANQPIDLDMKYNDSATSGEISAAIQHVIHRNPYSSKYADEHAVLILQPATHEPITIDVVGATQAIAYQPPAEFVCSITDLEQGFDPRATIVIAAMITLLAGFGVNQIQPDRMAIEVAVKQGQTEATAKVSMGRGPSVAVPNNAPAAIPVSMRDEGSESTTTQ